MCELLLVGVARTVGHACAKKCEKCEKEGKAYILQEFKNVSAFSNHTECKGMVVSQDDHVLTENNELRKYTQLFANRIF